MWIFTDSGFLSVVQHSQDPESLVVQTQSREEMQRLVEALEKIAGDKHEVVPADEQGCRFATVARREDLAQVVSRLVTEVNYRSFTQGVHFDFGSDPNFILWVNDGGVKVARIKPEVR